MKLPPDEPPRIVKPRKPKHTHRPIIAVTSSELLLEASGQIRPASELPQILVTEPSSIIVCQGFGPHLDRLRRTFAGNPDFQYRLTPQYRAPMDGDSPIRREYDSVCNFVGFSNRHRKEKGVRHFARYHYPLDPVVFVRASIDGFYPESSDGRIYHLLRFGQEVREFCRCNQLEVKPSAGGLAAQLLKDRRFYPNPRRKMPRLLNDISRTRLPGNFYRLRARPNVEHSCLYLDLASAHHRMALSTAFPDVNTLHRYGDDRPTEIVPRFYSREPRGFGLFKVRVNVPTIQARYPLPPWAERAGQRDAWIYSNELHLAKSLGVEIEGVYCSIVSHERDEGVNRYARFAIEYLRQTTFSRVWVKPTLLSAYGVLAARPRAFETGYLYADGGTRKEYSMGATSLPVFAHARAKPTETAVVNVLHRGMIESAVRTEVIEMSRNLAADGHTVLGIYADSIFVTPTHRGVGLLPPWWQVKADCSQIWFQDETHFCANTPDGPLDRQPGIPRRAGETDRRKHLTRRHLLIQSVA